MTDGRKGDIVVSGRSQVGVIGDYATVIQHIKQEYTIYPAADNEPAITPRLKEPLDELLKRHTPFGGREAELEELNNFLADSTGGYKFVTGLSGFGKSALLANWLHLLQKRGQDVSYHFMRRLEGVADEDTTLFNLCQQLASFHNLSGAIPQTSVLLRALYRDLLLLPHASGKSLVVVLDGLDEAQGWEPGPRLFPHPLPQGVFIIFSARKVSDKDWLKDLGLSGESIDPLELDRLGTLEISRLLQGAGGRAASFAENTAFVKNIWEVSKGDPFYLRFLVEDIQDGLISLDNIGKQPKGLDDYLKKWWEQLDADIELERSEIYDLLAFLTVARGALKPSDLAELSQELEKGALLKQNLSGRLRRYLTGNMESGFAISHPRFGDYLKASIFNPSEMKGYSNRLIEYCSRWPDHRSDYALANYAGHLAKEPDQYDILYTLIDDPWRIAQYERVHSHRAFSKDVELAIGIAKKSGNLKQTIRCSLVYATLGSLVGGVPPKVLGALAMLDLDQVTKARGYAQLIPDPKRRSMAYHLIGQALVANGELDQAREVLRIAIDVFESDYEKDSVIREMAPTLVLAQEYSQVLQVVDNRNQVLGLRNKRLRELLQSLVEVGELDEAYEVTQRVEDEQRQTQALAMLASILLEANEVERALEIVDEIIREPRGRMNITELAIGLVQVEEINRALDLIDAIGDQYSIDSLFKNLAPALVQADKVNQALTLNILGSEKDRVRSYNYRKIIKAFAVALLQAGQVEEAFDLVKKSIRGNKSDREWDQASVLQEMIDDSIEANEIERAMVVATRLTKFGERARKKRGDVAVSLARVNRLDQALILVEGIKQHEEKAQVLGSVAEVVLETYPKHEVIGIVNQSLSLSSSIRNKQSKAAILTQLAHILLHLGEKEQATKVAKQSLEILRWRPSTWLHKRWQKTIDFILLLEESEQEKRRAETLASTALFFMKAGDRAQALETANQALDTASAIDSWREYQAIKKVVPVLAVVGASDRAVAVIELIEEDFQRKQTFQALIQGLVEHGQIQKAYEINQDLADELIKKKESESKVNGDDFEQVIASSTALGDSTLYELGLELIRDDKIDEALIVAKKIGTDRSLDDDKVKDFIDALLEKGLSEDALKMVRVSQSRLALTALIGSYVQEGDYNKALQIANKRYEGINRSAVLKELALDLVRVDEAHPTLNVFEKIEDGWGKTELIRVLAQLRYFTAALSLVGERERDQARAESLGEIAWEMAVSGHRQAEEIANRALGIAEKVGYSQSKILALGSMALALAYDGKEDEVVSLVDELLENDIPMGQSGSSWKNFILALIEIREFNRPQTIMRNIKGWYGFADFLEEIYHALVKVEAFEQALTIAKSVEGAYRDSALGALTALLANEGELDWAWAAMEEIKGGSNKKDAILELTPALLQERTADSFERITNAIKSIDSAYYRDETFESLATTLVNAGELDWARTAMQEIEGEYRKAGVIVTVFPAFVRANKIEPIITAVRALESNSRFFEVLNECATILIDMGKSDRLPALVEKLSDDNSIVVAQKDIVLALVRANEYEQAVAALAAIKDEQRSYVANELACNLVNQGEFQWAVKVVEDIKTQDSRNHTLQEIALISARLRKPEWAFEAVGTINDEWSKFFALEAVIPALARARVFNRGLIAAKEIEGEWRRNRVLEKLVLALVAIGEIERAYNTAKSIEHDVTKAKSLAECGRAWMQAGDAERAKETISEACVVAEVIWSPTEKVDALCEVVLAFARLGDEDEAYRLANQASDVAEEVQKFDAMIRIALLMAQLGYKDRAVETRLQAESLNHNAYAEDREKKALVTALTDGVYEGLLIGTEDNDSQYFDTVAFKKLAIAVIRAGGFEKAVDISNIIEAEYKYINREDLWRDLILAGIRTGEVESALEMAEIFVKEEQKRLSVLKMVAAILLEAGEYERAFKANSTIEGELQPVITKLGLDLAREGKFNQTLTTVAKWLNLIEESTLREIVHILASINPDKLVTLTEASDGERVKSMALEEATLVRITTNGVESALSALENKYQKETVLVRIADSLAKSGDFTKALQVARAAKQKRNSALKTIVLSLIEVGELGQASMITREIGGGDDKDQVLKELASAFLQANEIDNALSAVDEIREDRVKAETLLEIISALGGIQSKNKLLESGMTVLAAVKKIGEGNRTDKIVKQLALALLQADEIDNALTAAGEIGEDRVKAEVLSKIISALDGIENRNRLLESGMLTLAAVKAIRYYRREKANMLIELAPILIKAGNKDQALTAIENMIDDNEAKAMALCKSSQALIESGERDLASKGLLDAFDTARLIGRNYFYDVLNCGVPVIASICESQALVDALQSISEVEGWWSVEFPAGVKKEALT